MARTETGRYRFTVKEDAEGQPFIAMDPSGAAIEAFGDALLSLGLKGGTSIAYAQQIAQVLNDSVTDLSATFFDKAADA